jgi:hypothetical protein
LAAGLPSWCAEDPDIAALALALQTKVYARTIKEAQYDLLMRSGEQPR